MRGPLIAVTGFGPFLGVERNASGEVVRALARTFDAPRGGSAGAIRVATEVLPVTFGGVESALDALLAALAPERPAALLALGVHQDGWFRLERRARARLDSRKPDQDGRFARELATLAGGELATDVDLEAAAERLRAAGAAEVRLSSDAGGFVCERAYHAVLLRARELCIPGLFLHVPPVEVVPPEEQTPVVAELVRWLAGGSS